MQISDCNARADVRNGPIVVCLIRDRRISAKIVQALEDGGFRITRSFSAEAPQAVLVDRASDIVSARTRFAVPIIAIGALESSDDAESAIFWGADEYVPADVFSESLVARIVARSGLVADVLTFEDLVLYRRERIVRRGRRRLLLSARENRLLVALMARPYTCHTIGELIATIWGGTNVKCGTVHTFVCLLRRKLNAGGEADLIETVRGLGYRLRSAPAPNSRARYGAIARLRTAESVVSGNQARPSRAKSASAPAGPSLPAA